MQYLDILTDICTQIGDPDLDTFKERAKDHFIRAVSDLILAGQYTEQDLPGYFKYKDNVDFNDGGTEHLNETDLTTADKWDFSGQVAFDTDHIEFVFAGGSLNGYAEQTAANRAFIGQNSKRYKFTYTITVNSAPDGDFDLSLESGVTLPFTVGTHTVYFTSSTTASTSAFRITASETTSTQGDIDVDDVSLQLLEYEDVSSLNILKIDKLFAHPMLQPGNTSGKMVILKTVNEISKIAFDEAQFGPSNRELFVHPREDRLYLIISDSCTFVPGTDKIIMTYIEYPDNSGWSDSTYITTETSNTGLLSVPFVNKAIGMAVASLKEEEFLNE